MGEGCLHAEMGAQAGSTCFSEDLEVGVRRSRGLQTFSARGRRVNTSGFESHVVSVQMIQTCHCLVNTAVYNVRTSEYCRAHETGQKRARATRELRAPVTWACKWSDQLLN